MILDNAVVLDDSQISQLQQMKQTAWVSEANYYQLGRILVEMSQTRAPELYAVLLSMNHYDIGSYASIGARSAA